MPLIASLTGWRKKALRCGSVVPFALCLVTALGLALLPLLLWRWSLGNWIYIADNDNLYYLELAARIYHDHGWHLSDPVIAGGWTPFPWMQFVPAAMLARTIGLGPFAINTIWLVIAGFGAAAGSYFLFYQFLRRPWPAAFSTILVVASANLRNGEPVVRQVISLVRIVSGHSGELLAYGASLFEQYRVVHPGLSFPLVLLQVGFVAHARLSQRKDRALLPGLFFALTIYSSLYDWTAIVLALAAAFVLDRPQRRCYAQAAAIGLLIGLPGIIHGMAMKPLAVGLPRISLLLKIPRNSYLMVPKVGIALTILIGGWIALRRRSDLIYLWALAPAALALSDSARVTGVELHNGHWSYVWGPMINILLLIILVTEMQPYWRRQWTTACAVAVAMYVMTGVYLRAQEGMKTHEGAVIREELRAYEAQRMRTGIPPLEPGSVIAGDELFAELASVAEDQRPLAGYAALQTATMTDDEWELRWALNRYLSGISRDQFVGEAQAFAATYQWGPWAYGEISRSELADRLIAHFDGITRDPQRVIQNLHVRYLAIPRNQEVPAPLPTGWKVIQQGPTWTIDENDTSSS
jgi:hypothetical protein